MHFRACVLVLVLTCLANYALATDARAEPKITKDQARAIALARHQGTVKSSELEKEHGKLVYSFDIQTAEGIREVQVDAMTGKVVEDTIESAADEAKEAAQEKHRQSPPKK